MDRKTMPQTSHEPQQGFSKDSLVTKVDIFDCIVCFNVSRNPIACQSCGQTYCKSCQEQWKKDNGGYLCLKCEGSRMKQLNNLLMEEYQQIKLACSCKKVFVMSEFEKHEEFCKLPNCKHFSHCGKKAVKEFGKQQVCSKACMLFDFARSPSISQNELYLKMMEILGKQAPKQVNPSNHFRLPVAAESHSQKFANMMSTYASQMNFVNVPNDMLVNQVPPFHKQLQRTISTQSLSSMNDISYPFQNKSNPFTRNSNSYQKLNFEWDNRDKYRGQNIKISENGKNVLLKENVYIFKNVVANQPFQSGEHYFEIQLETMTENEIKIGVSTTNDIPSDQAFCDVKTGYGYYTQGKLRNGSNANGNDYGAKFKNSGTVGVYLNMNKGILAFSYQGINQGKAFETQALKKGPIYAAVALLHCAGFKLQSGLEIPQWANPYR